jgi:ribosome hibernation promoting factor
MQLSVTGKQIDVGDALRGHIATNLDAAVSKYFDKAIEGSVVIARGARMFRADISVHVGHNILLQGHAEAGDAYSAFDAACERIAKRLRRHKRRLREHRKNSGKGEAEVMVVNQYILAGDDEEIRGADGDNPVVVAELETQIETLTVSEAVMRMDLAELSAVMFRNRGTGGINMVYRRGDGNIGWIDPQGSKTPKPRTN